MYLIDGKAYAECIKKNIKELSKHDIETNGAPVLAMIVVGDNPASATYVRNKKRALDEVGFTYVDYYFEEDITEKELINTIQVLNESEKYHGIFVQFPLPGHLNEQYIASFIAPEKDVDGFTDVNVAGNVKGKKSLVPCTAQACEILINGALRQTCPTPIFELEPKPSKRIGAHVVIVGRSEIVGKPLSHLLTNHNYTVTVCHSKTPKHLVKSLCQQADVVVAAAGVPGLITSDMVKPGAVVIDVGINFVEVDGKRKMVGDVDFENVKNVAGAITPVPGGVGPMTVACLVKNLYSAYCMQMFK